MEIQHKGEYLAPEIGVVEMEPVSVICTSGEDMIDGGLLG